MTQIVDIRLREVQVRLAPKKITLDLDQGAKGYLASIGYSPVYGARPLNRALQHELLNPLSVFLLEERIQPGEVCQVRFDGPHNRLYIIPNHPPTISAEEMDIDMEDDEEDEWLLSGAKAEGERT